MHLSFPGDSRLARRSFCRALMGAPLAVGAAGRRPPNIVLIYADDLGYGDVSANGARHVHTPNIDRIAREGVRFTHAHSPAATCTPSRYSLLTGEYAWRRPGTGVLPGDARLIIDPGRPTLPAMLRSRGYRTGVVGKWHLGLGSGELDWNAEIRPGPLEIGFDEAFLIPATGDRVPCVYVENHRVVNLDPADPIRVSYKEPFPGEPLGRTHPHLLRMLPSHGHDMAIVNGISRIGSMTGGKKALWKDEDMADTITARALDFIARHRQEPFFLYFATHDIHVPRVPHPRFVGRSGMGPRGDAIVQLDWCVGEILGALDRHGVSRDTLLIFTSDNGPVLDDGYRDNAVEKLGNHRPAGPWRGGKYSIFEGGTRVPFLVRWPGHGKHGTASRALVSQIDLFASLASLAGVRLEDDAAPDSFDVLPALLGQSARGRDHLVEQAGTLALIEGRWKYVAPGRGARVSRETGIELGNDPAPQLFDLEQDPGERINLAAQHPERVGMMAERLERIRATPRTRP
ncbi:MAG: arylsulfatase [Bryobacteraceae bacterium]|nr:MAG: arylsulfatase [Bryobacteraceae bacterium]